VIKLYYVGGAVRDAYLNRPSKDIDYAVEAPSYEVMKEYIVLWGGEIFLEHPEYYTIRARIPGQLTADYVLCRKDGEYIDGRHPANVEVGTIYDDLARRDFTMNAIAVDTESGEVTDPYNGVDDISMKCIKAVGDAEKRFREDSLRILRAIRFSVTLNFWIDIDTFQAMQRNRELIYTADENRVRDELDKCFKANSNDTINHLNELDMLDIVLSRVALKPTMEKEYMRKDASSRVTMGAH